MQNELDANEELTEEEMAFYMQEDLSNQNGSETDQKKNTEKEKSYKKKEIRSWIITIALAFILAYVITHFIVIKAEIPTGSMERTIMTDDKIVGNRLAYLFSEPERGDVVIFIYPDDESENYVKRIIGLPGETVEIIKGKVYIDGSAQPLDEPYLSVIMRGSFGPYEVPEGSYFMLGDNRNTSKDSRYWENTYVTKDKLVAKAWFRYSPTFGSIQ